MHEADDEIPILPPKDVIVSRIPAPLVELTSHAMSLAATDETAQDLPRRTVLIRQDTVQEIILPFHISRRS